MAHKAAVAIEEALHLALRMMEAAGTRPTIRAAEDRLVSERRLDSLQLIGDQVKRFVPRHLDERLLAALVARRSGAALEPALADRGSQHAQPRHLVRQHVQADRRGVGILGERVQLRGLARFVVFDFVDAPVGGGERTLMGHLELRLCSGVDASCI